VWASDFDIGSFDNCPGNLTFAFDTSGQILEREYCCDSLEASGGTSGLFELRIYVIDENGNYDYCTTYLRIDDTNDECPNSSPIKINGEVSMLKNNSGINATDITLFDVSNQLISNQLTGNTGKYAFDNLISGGEYEVIPAKNDDPLNGVTTQDLIAIQRHILGINEFDEAYEFIASDINRSNGISTKDIIALRKLILGSYDSFEEIHPDQRSWRFVEADHLFIDPSQPWDFNESTRFTSLNKAERANFKGVKIGDVNGSADPGINSETESRNNGNVSISAEDLVFSTGDQISLKLNFADIGKTIGNQFTLEFDTDVLTFDGIDKLSTKISEANFGFTRIKNGKITFSWNTFDNQAMGTNEYATLIFKAKDSGKLSDFVKMNSSVTRAEAYFNIDEVSGLSLEFRGNGNVIESYALFQNNPNPFRDETIIGFELPKAAKANVTVFDITGKTLRIIEVDGVKGYNETLIKKDEISATGILYYQLDTEGFTSTKKMVLVK
jgi:hypothetical protein